DPPRCDHYAIQMFPRFAVEVGCAQLQEFEEDQDGAERLTQIVADRPIKLLERLVRAGKLECAIRYAAFEIDVQAPNVVLGFAPFGDVPDHRIDDDPSLDL